MIRLLALDLDGTLMDDDMVIQSHRVRRAVAAAQERGVLVGRNAAESLFDAPVPSYDKRGTLGAHGFFAVFFLLHGL